MFLMYPADKGLTSGNTSFIIGNRLKVRSDITFLNGIKYLCIDLLIPQKFVTQLLIVESYP